MNDVKLFHKFQSRAFQFSLDVLNAFRAGEILSKGAVTRISQKNGLLYADQVMQALEAAEVVEQTGRGWKLGKHMNAFQVPPGQTELDYLQYILRLPETSLFLDNAVIQKLGVSSTSFFAPIQIIGAKGEPIPEYPGPEGFRLILKAIRQGRLIQYYYRTKNDETLSETIAQPWKVEYSAFDKRWWVILYLPGEDRTIKARLENLRDIRLLEPSNIDEGKIQEAVERLLAPEPIVLEVSNQKGALERCFMVFENQLFTETSRTPAGNFKVEFRYYRFDESEIVRRLLYLGPMVTLKGPGIIKGKLTEALEKAIAL